MSLSLLNLNEIKPWLNPVVNNITIQGSQINTGGLTVDGEFIAESQFSLGNNSKAAAQGSAAFGSGFPVTYGNSLGGSQTTRIGIWEDIANTKASLWVTVMSSGFNGLTIGGGTGSMDSMSNITFNIGGPGVTNGTSVAQFDSNGYTQLNYGMKMRVIQVIANTTLDQTYSGNIIQLTTQSAGSYTITLPAASSSGGFKYTFSVKNVTNANNIVISTHSSENTLTGFVYQNSLAGSTTGKHSITLNQGDLSVGDYIKLTCDSTSWLMNAVSTNAIGAAFTFA